MSQINISNLSFKYDNSSEYVFQDVNLILDSSWKLGLIGRNGRGKTTLLKILMGELKGRGNIKSTQNFGYFPFDVEDRALKSIDVVKNAIAPFSFWESEMERCIATNDMDKYGEIFEKYTYNEGYVIDELIKKEVGQIGLSWDLLNRAFDTLSGGEQTKLLLVALFLKKNHFLLIDEPTNHLDVMGRKIVGDYLLSKNGFILVSHDRAFVDKVVDHILSINKENIEIQRGNFTSWDNNRIGIENFEKNKNARIKKDINRLEKTAKEKETWSNKVEASKFGNGPCDRGFIGHKSAKMMKRSKNLEKRFNDAIDEKSKLLKNIEQVRELEIFIDEKGRSKVAFAKDLTIDYGEGDLFKLLSFEINKGERICLKGENGCGKSSILKIFAQVFEQSLYKSDVSIPKNVSYIPQDTSFLKGDLDFFIENNNIDGAILKSNLFKLGFNKDDFHRKIEDFSEGQRKKLLIAKSLCDKAELYIWDEPLNYIDIISRKQIEDLILKTKPTMLIVEHDELFVERIATKIIEVEIK
ncbi:MAG: ribosomal protection-like ABC-F family protein [Lachnospirales bacterium]